MRDLALAEGLYLLSAGGLARFQLDPGAELLAVFLVGHAHHLHRLHLGMAEEELLDLAWIDILAAADHHVLDAPDDVEVTVLIHGGEVAGMHPSGAVDRLRRALGIVPISLHHAVSARAKFTGRSWRHDPALAVDDLHFDMGMDAAHRADAALERIVARGLRADGRGLGHAVGDRHLAHVHLR